MVLKTAILSLLVGSISIVHITYVGSEMGFHILHQQLFFIPLILASFWFGLQTASITALVISLLYGLPMLFGDHQHSSHLIVFTQIALYFFVGLLIGWLSDRQRKQQRKLVKNERGTALGKAASALSFEVQSIVRRIESIHKHAGSNGDKSAYDDMLSEIDRLKNLLTSLSKFSKPLGNLSLSHDLNKLIQQRVPTYQKLAHEKRIKILIDLDQNGCPTMITSESIPRVIDSLVDNAIDFSKSGQSIVISSAGRGEFCLLGVSDSGPGVSKENKNQLFSVFFTTKEDGYGLSLSSGRKMLRDLGGDLFYESNENGGATFKMKIPRDSSSENAGDYVNSTLPEQKQKTDSR